MLCPILQAPPRVEDTGITSDLGVKTRLQLLSERQASTFCCIPPATLAEFQKNRCSLTLRCPDRAQAIGQAQMAHGVLCATSAQLYTIP